MITLNFNAVEFFDNEINEFCVFPSKTVDFEYSLAAVSKWEAKWKIPFLSYSFMGSDLRLLDFYLCMSNDPTLEIEYLTEDYVNALSTYIGDTQTATTFNSQNGNSSRGPGKVYTSEEIYALMCMNGIPIEFEDRNLNRLLIILRIISVYSNPPPKMNKQDIMKQNQELNAMRKKEFNTRG